jgi:hypothetical protein
LGGAGFAKERHDESFAKAWAGLSFKEEILREGRILG